MKIQSVRGNVICSPKAGRQHKSFEKKLCWKKKETRVTHILHQESAREEETSGLQKRRKMPSCVDGDQALPRLQVPGLPEVV